MNPEKIKIIGYDKENKITRKLVAKMHNNQVITQVIKKKTGGNKQHLPIIR